MKRFQRMLVALDLTPGGGALTSGSRLAVDHALQIAKSLGAEVELYHSKADDEAWDPDQDRYVPTNEFATDMHGKVLQAAEARFAAAGVSAELVVDEDKAWQGIIHRVLRDQIDLVIAGKRNETETKGHWVGSTSNKLLRKCPCAVWVAKPGSDPIPKCILAATDLGPVGERVVEHACFLASEYDAELHVVHTFQRPLAIQMEGGPASANYEKHHRKLFAEQIEAQVEALKYTGEVSYYVGLSSPTQGILEVAEHIEPNLAVMGTATRGGVAGLLLGNTAERLISRLNCSLLTVKPADFICPVSLD